MALRRWGTYTPDLGWTGIGGQRGNVVGTLVVELVTVTRPVVEQRVQKIIAERQFLLV